MGFLQLLEPLAYPDPDPELVGSRLANVESSMGAAKTVAENNATKAKESKFLILNRGILGLVCSIDTIAYKFLDSLPSAYIVNRFLNRTVDCMDCGDRTYKKVERQMWCISLCPEFLTREWKKERMKCLAYLT